MNWTKDVTRYALLIYYSVVLLREGEQSLYKPSHFVLQVRVKPASAEVEVDLSIDVDSKNYDPEAPNAQRMNKQVYYKI